MEIKWVRVHKARNWQRKEPGVGVFNFAAIANKNSLNYLELDTRRKRLRRRD
jgi:hypothetical protein